MSKYATCGCNGAALAVPLCGCEIAAVVTVLNAWMSHPNTVSNTSPEFNKIRLRVASATIKLCDAGEELSEEILTDDWPSTFPLDSGNTM